MNAVLSICFRWFKCTNKSEQLRYACTSLYYMVKFDQELLFNSKISHELDFSYITNTPEDYLKPFNTPHTFTDMFNLLFLDGEMLVKLMSIPNDRVAQRKIHFDMLDRESEDLYQMETPDFTRTAEFYRTLERFLMDNVSVSTVYS